MLKHYLNIFARKIKGHDYTIDPALSTRALLNFGCRRALQLLRGAIRFRKILFIGKNVTTVNKGYLSIENGTTLHDGVFIDAASQNGVKLGKNCNIGPMTVVQATGVISRLGKGLSIGENSGIGGFSFIGCGGGVIIGANVIMGQYVSFHSENHVFDDVTKPIRTQGVTRVGIRIHDDCWVGAKVTFLDGAEVGNGCVVAAGSVVKGYFPPNSIIAGIPAKVIRSRVSNNQ